MNSIDFDFWTGNNWLYFNKVFSSSVIRINILIVNKILIRKNNKAKKVSSKEFPNQINYLKKRI